MKDLHKYYLSQYTSMPIGIANVAYLLPWWEVIDLNDWITPPLVWYGIFELNLHKHTKEAYCMATQDQEMWRLLGSTSSSWRHAPVTRRLHVEAISWSINHWHFSPNVVAFFPVWWGLFPRLWCLWPFSKTTMITPL